MPKPMSLRWIEVDEDAAVLALEFGARGVVLLAVKKACPADPTVGYWLSDQGKVLGQIEVGLA